MFITVEHFKRLKHKMTPEEILEHIEKNLNKERESDVNKIYAKMMYTAIYLRELSQDLEKSVGVKKSIIDVILKRILELYNSIGDGSFITYDDIVTTTLAIYIIINGEYDYIDTIRDLLDYMPEKYNGEERTFINGIMDAELRNRNSASYLSIFKSKSVIKGIFMHGAGGLISNIYHLYEYVENRLQEIEKSRKVNNNAYNRGRRDKRTITKK